MRRSMKRSYVILVVVLMLMVVSGCESKEQKMAGSYTGSIGAFIQLNEDGTCYYSEKNILGSVALDGTWYIEGNILNVNLDYGDGYRLYAELKEKEGFLLESDEDQQWTDEYFSKD